MRILHIYKDYYPVLGGIENHVRLVAEGQAAAGHDVTVLTTNAGWHTSEEDMGGVHVVKCSRLATVASTPLSLTLPLYLRRLCPDVTHLHFPYPVGEVAQYMFGRGRRTVLTYHSDVVRQQHILRLYRPVMTWVLEAVDAIIVTSPNYLASSRVLGAYSDKCRIVPLAVERDRFLTIDSGAARAVRGRFGEPIILSVGVLRYYKGLEYLIRAMRRVPGHLVVVGDGPMLSKWRDEALTLGVSDRVHFAGRVSDDDLPFYYGAADLFVLPSSARSEAFGLVLLEAMSSGLPVISTELGTGTSFVNHHGESGLVVPPRDSDALSEAILRLLNDETYRATLGEGARKRSAQFTVEAMLCGVDSVYEEVLSACSL